MRVEQQQNTEIDSIRRQFFLTALKVYLILLLLFAISSIIAFLILQTVGMGLYTLATIILFVGAAISFWMTSNKQALSLAVIPASLGIFIVGLVHGIFLPEAEITQLFLLVLVILFGSFIGHRKVAITLSTLSVIIAVLNISMPQSSMAQPLGAINVLLAPAAVSAILLLIWVIADRNARTQEETMRVANQRAAEADEARVLAERAQREAEQRMQEQQHLLDIVQSLEMPVISLGADILASPLVGSLDSRRIEAIQKRLLETVAERHARIVILDVTGVSVIDTGVAHALLSTAQAVRLLGAKTIVSGIGANIAQTLATLGVDFEHIHTVSDMGQALAYAQELRPNTMPHLN